MMIECTNLPGGWARLPLETCVNRQRDSGFTRLWGEIWGFNKFPHCADCDQGRENLQQWERMEKMARGRKPKQEPKQEEKQPVDAGEKVESNPELFCQNRDCEWCDTEADCHCDLHGVGATECIDFTILGKQEETQPEPAPKKKRRSPDLPSLKLSITDREKPIVEWIDKMARENRRDRRCQVWALLEALMEDSIDLAEISNARQ